MRLITHGKHPNRAPFRGVLAFVDTVSCKSPSGAHGHLVLLTRAAAKAALSGLVGMAVDYRSGWDGHDARQKCGIITSASLIGKEIRVRGFIYARDYPEVLSGVARHPSPMGMSYELADAHVEDFRSPVWTLTRCTFTGAAVLARNKAAYSRTRFAFEVQ